MPGKKRQISDIGACFPTEHTGEEKEDEEAEDEEEEDNAEEEELEEDEDEDDDDEPKAPAEPKVLPPPWWLWLW